MGARSNLPPVAGAAFFDLDKTLMEGSSAFHFGRAAYRAGLHVPAAAAERRLGKHQVPHQRLHRRGNRGAAPADPRRDRGHAGQGPDAAGARRAGRDPAAHLPRRARDRVAAPGRRAARLHRDRGVAGAGRVPRRRAPARRGHRLPLRGQGRRVHRPPGRAVHLSRGQGDGDPRAGRAGGDRPLRVLRVLRLRVRPPDAARGGPSGGGEPRQRAGAGGARGGLGDHALRQARPPAQARRRGGRGRGDWRDRRRGGGGAACASGARPGFGCGDGERRGRGGPA